MNSLRRYSVEDLASLLHKRSNPYKAMAFTQAYFDDSGTHSSSLVTSIGGFVGTAEAWTKLEKDWIEYLASLEWPIGWFRSYDCEHGEGEFQGLSRKVRELIRNKLVKIIASHPVTAIWSSVVVEDWDAVATGSFARRYKSPHDLCFDECMMQIGIWARKHAPEHPVSLTVAQHPQHQPQMNAIHDAYSRHPAIGNFLGPLQFCPMKSTVPLQVADVLAYEMNKEWEEAIYPPDGPSFAARLQFRPILEKFSESNGLAYGGCMVDGALSLHAFRYNLEDVDPVSTENFRRLFATKPGQTTELLPYWEIDTSQLVLLDNCPECDTPHCHIRGSNRCLR